MIYATCRTDGCGNAGHAIPLDFIDPAEPTPAVVCGACAQPIADLVDDVAQVTP
jgi:hypothetical protein